MSLRNKFESLPRLEGVSDRLVLVGFGGRFMDELLSGLPTVLMPTLRSYFGLSYTQVSVLGLALGYVALVIEPVAGLLIDIWKRRWLMAIGAAAIGLATMVMGLAPTFIVLVAGFAIYGLGSGPLAHTADVVLIESYPGAPDRIFTRATLLDTVGALLSSLLVSVTFFLGLEWRWLLISLGLSSVVYSVIILTTKFPPRQNQQEVHGLTASRALLVNIRSVISNKQTLRWLLFLFILSVAEAPITFSTIWLREEVGMSQALIGTYKALEMAIGIASLIFLDRWLSRSGYRRILLIAAAGVAVLYPAWLFVPGIPARFFLSIPLGFLFTVFWPIGRSQSLSSAPGLGGTVSAMLSLMAIVPLPLLFGMLAEATALTSSMFWVTSASTLAMIAVVLSMNRAGSTKIHKAQK